MSRSYGCVAAPKPNSLGSPSVISVHDSRRRRRCGACRRGSAGTCGCRRAASGRAGGRRSRSRRTRAASRLAGRGCAASSSCPSSVVSKKPTPWTIAQKRDGVVGVGHQRRDPEVPRRLVRRVVPVLAPRLLLERRELRQGRAAVAALPDAGSLGTHQHAAVPDTRGTRPSRSSARRRARAPRSSAPTSRRCRCCATRRSRAIRSRPRRRGRRRPGRAGRGTRASSRRRGRASPSRGGRCSRAGTVPSSFRSRAVSRPSQSSPPVGFRDSEDMTAEVSRSNRSRLRGVGAASAAAPRSRAPRSPRAAARSAART